MSAARVALVTGASSGLGLAIAMGMASAGWRVYAGSRRGSGAAASGVQALRLDVTSDDSLNAAIDTIRSQEGKLDAVVSNAGFGIAGAIEDTSVSEAKAQFETNFFGNHRVCLATLPLLKASGRARLIVIGSIGGLIGMPFQAMYSATKFALEAYCESLRMELRGTKVAVSILEPGDFATGFTDARLQTAASKEGSEYTDAFQRAMRIVDSDERDGADPQMVAEAVLDLLDDEHPPLRRVVAAPAQAGLGRAKCDIDPDALRG